MDTIYQPMQMGKLMQDFGSEYPAVLAQLHKDATREQAKAAMKKGAEPLQITIPGKGVALFKMWGSAHNPFTDVVEFGVCYIGLSDTPTPDAAAAGETQGRS
jgi:hypothetical protein